MKSSASPAKSGRKAFVLLTLAVLAGCITQRAFTPYEEPQEREVEFEEQKYVIEQDQPTDVALRRSAGCIGCHQDVHDPHPESAKVSLSCVDCHGGDGLANSIALGHPRPHNPEKWISAANPERLYAHLDESGYEWIRFVNPGDLRVARQTCGVCHEAEVLQVSKSLMTTAAHFWGSAAYCNGIFPAKRTIFGESYSPEGIPQKVNTVPPPTPEEEARGIVPFVVPLPRFEISQTGNILRVFEKGSRLGGPGLGANGAPLPSVGLPDKLEDPGRPNNRQSDRGFGTLLRIDLPLLNVHKTRLNDPHLSYLGTNDNPGDYRSSGCTACHVVYANDRNPMHSGPYAKFGNQGYADNPDPTIVKGESGHPIAHTFTRGVPSSQCMVCHMHQPNSFVNSYYGYTMWNYEADGEAMWPEQQHDPTDEELVKSLDHNPEEAAARGLWRDQKFLQSVAVEQNPKLRHTQFADYHGHGWIFRAVLKTDRKGNLLDAQGQTVNYSDPAKFAHIAKLDLSSSAGASAGANPNAGSAPPLAVASARKAVHMMDIHAERGMHCVDCHFAQDVHGDTKLYAEYQAAVEIRCQDCHGTTLEAATLDTSGPAAQGRNLLTDLKETPSGEARFEIDGNKLIQHSMVTPGLSWEVPQIFERVLDPDAENYNRKAAYAHTVRKDGVTFGGQPEACDLAHQPERMDCYTCHTSWVTSCFGCHLPQRANWLSDTHHFEPEKLRNYASYNPQVARDDAFMLGVSGNVKGNTIAPVRSSSAVLISAEDAQRQLTYTQIPPIAANGMSSQAFNTHFPHTVRTTETRQCSDCHVSDRGDNNAWLAQVMLLGAGYVNFMGYHCYVANGSDGFSAVEVTEWTEPQAVRGSYLHKLAYPRNYEQFKEHEVHHVPDEKRHHGKGEILSVQLLGEYLLTASGADGFRVYDVANIANKGFSERIVTSPVSPLGQDTRVDTSFATAVALATNNRVSMARLWRPENHEVSPYPERPVAEQQNLHETYRYAYITDRQEGLILVDIDTLTDGEPQNNFLKRAVTFNPEGILNGAVNLTVAGATVYVCCDRGVVAIDVETPLQPQVIAVVGAPAIVNPRSISVQFRYAFVADREGIKVLDVTLPQRMQAVTGATVAVADARDIYVARTYAYVAAGAEGLLILDIEKPTQPRIDQLWNANGAINDLHQVKIAMTYDSIFAYMADGKNGLRIAAMVSPEDDDRSPYAFAPRPRPNLIATYATHGSALAISRPLDRDRAVDESGHQMAVFGRIGGRPMNLEEMRRLYMRGESVYTVSDEPTRGPLRDGEESGEKSR